jgi:predicted CopG family antitoxin
MASTQIVVNEKAYAVLKKLKQPGDTFSDVLLRELPQPLETAGELEDYFVKHGVPEADPKLRAAMLTGRGRRSNRKAAK